MLDWVAPTAIFRKYIELLYHFTRSRAQIVWDSRIVSEPFANHT